MGTTDAGGDAICVATAKPATVVADADTRLSADACAGANVQGAYPYAYIVDGTTDGIALFRFSLDAQQRADILAGSAVATLVLTADPKCTGCGGDLPTKAGRILAHAMRTDWDEGKGAGYDGADHCRRTSGDPGVGWGASPAPASSSSAIASGADYEATSSAAALADGDAQVRIVLDRATLTPAFFASPVLAFYVEATNGGALVAATKDAADVAKRPRLEITSCLK